jgi:flagellar basal body-associated protein FliL
MVARLMPTQEPLKLTQENHPENAKPEEKLPTVSLASTICIGALCSLAGMTLGSAALSSTFLADGPWNTISMIPLVATLVSLIGGWMGAFFWMFRDEAAKKGE